MFFCNVMNFSNTSSPFSNSFINLIKIILMTIGFGILCPKPCLGESMGFQNRLRVFEETPVPLQTTFMYGWHWPGQYMDGSGEEFQIRRVMNTFDPVINAQLLPHQGTYFFKYGLSLIPYQHMGVNPVGGAAVSKEFRKRYPDWQEQYEDGTPADSRACLSHPDLIPEVIDSKIEAFKSGLTRLDKQQDSILGVYLESEPSMGGWKEVQRLGGHPATRALYVEWLAQQYPGGIHDLNRVTGTQFNDFSDVDLFDDNQWLTALAGRFRTWLVYGHYQKNIVDTLHRELPDFPVISRWVDSTGFATPHDSDWSYFESVDVDVLGITCYPYSNRGTPMGQYSANLSYLQPYGKPIVMVEHGMKDSNRYLDRTGLFRPLKPDEVIHYTYRSLYYGVKMATHFAWFMPEVNNEGLTVSQNFDTLQAIRDVRQELARIEPYHRFGERLPPETLILISRNANHYPGLDGGFYGNIFVNLYGLLNVPRSSGFDIMEEHALTPELLNQYENLIVFDAAMTSATRNLVGQWIEADRPCLLFTAPEVVGPNYLPAPIPESWPISSVRPAGDMKGEGVKVKVTDENIFHEIEGLHLIQPGYVSPKVGGDTIISIRGNPVGVRRRQTTIIAGLPSKLRLRGISAGEATIEDREYKDGGFGLKSDDVEIQTRLDAPASMMYEFVRNLGGDVLPDVFVSRFEKAMVVQNYEAVPSLREEAQSWTGELDFPEEAAPSVFEERSQMYWLAMNREKGQLTLQGLHLEPDEVRVFTSAPASELPYFTDIPEGLGFLEFKLYAGRLRTKIRADQAGTFSLRFVPGASRAAMTWSERPEDTAWLLGPVDEKGVIHQGTGFDIQISLEADTVYTLEARTLIPR